MHSRRVRQSAALRKAVTAIVAIVLAALVVDRVALYVWQVQVIRFYRSLHRTLAAGHAKPPDMRFGYVASGLEPLLVMPKSSDRFPVRYLTLRTDDLLVKPNTITVDGAGGLHLRFLPPPLAWTTAIIPRGGFWHHADPVDLDPRLYYQFTLDVESLDSGVSVILDRGPYHFDKPLSAGELKPLLFP
jgi:hypothetical protein